MTAGLCQCGPAEVRAVSADRCACGGVFYREVAAAGSAESPALAGEVWRFDDGSGAVTIECDIAQAWYWQPAPHGEARAWAKARGMVGGVILAAWALAERARADRAEAAVAAFRRASGCADGVTLAVMAAAAKGGDA